MFWWRVVVIKGTGDGGGCNSYRYLPRRLCDTLLVASRRCVWALRWELFALWAPHLGVMLSGSEKHNPLSDPNIKIYRCPDRAPSIHTHLAGVDPLVMTSKSKYINNSHFDLMRTPPVFRAERNIAKLVDWVWQKQRKQELLLFPLNYGLISVTVIKRHSLLR